MWWSERVGHRPAPCTARLPAAAAALLALLVLGGCGFHLRGTPKLPPELSVTYVEAKDRYSPFYVALTTALRQNGATLVQDPAAARTVIHVLADDTGSRVLSVSSRNVPTAYEVWYRVRFSVTVDGTEAVPAEPLALARDYSFNETEVLGEARQEQILRQAMAEDLVGLVARRLSAIH